METYYLMGNKLLEYAELSSNKVAPFIIPRRPLSIIMFGGIMKKTDMYKLKF